MTGQIQEERPIQEVTNNLEFLHHLHWTNFEHDLTQLTPALHLMIKRQGQIEFKDDFHWLFDLPRQCTNSPGVVKSNQIKKKSR